MVINHDLLAGIEAHQLAFIHDELQFETTPTHVDTLQASLVSSAAAAESTTNSEFLSQQKQKLRNLGRRSLSYVTEHHCLGSGSL